LADDGALSRENHNSVCGRAGSRSDDVRDSAVNTSEPLADVRTLEGAHGADLDYRHAHRHCRGDGQAAGGPAIYRTGRPNPAECVFI
jgi:hypothetical protein